MFAFIFNKIKQDINITKFIINTIALIFMWDIRNDIKYTIAYIYTVKTIFLLLIFLYERIQSLAIIIINRFIKKANLYHRPTGCEKPCQNKFRVSNKILAIKNEKIINTTFFVVPFLLYKR